jgi:hypothetical protein
VKKDLLSLDWVETGNSFVRTPVPRSLTIVRILQIWIATDPQNTQSIGQQRLNSKRYCAVTVNLSWPGGQSSDHHMSKIFFPFTFGDDLKAAPLHTIAPNTRPFRGNFSEATSVHASFNRPFSKEK